MMKRSSVITMAAVLLGLAVLAAGVLFPLARPGHRFQVRCYFQDAQGLREGAGVRMAGVRVGTVTGICVRPELHSAQVTIELHTPYKLEVPSDTVASVESVGILGESFVEIDIRNTAGPPLSNGGVLKSGPSKSPGTKEWLNCLSELAAHKPCTLGRGSDKPHNLPARK